MWLTIAGFDRTTTIPFDSVKLSQTSNDPAPELDFDLIDNNASLSISMYDEIIVWDESYVNTSILSSSTLYAPPSHNLSQNFDTSWSTTGPLSLFVSVPGLTPGIIFNSVTYSGGNNFQSLVFTSAKGYIYPGQKYMFSTYLYIPTTLVNAQCTLNMQYLDGNQNAIGSVTTSTITASTGATAQRFSISSTAPALSSYVKLWISGIATTSGDNSGFVQCSTPQCEPMYFQNTVTYPTPDCNKFQASCALMPDGTTSRAVRLFSGYINYIQKEYVGPVRIYHLKGAGAGKQLEDGLINATYTGQTDTAIITDIINTYFAGKLSISAANVFLPSPLVTGANVTTVTYNDSTLRDVLNQLIGLSFYIYFVDPYYRLYYQPQFSVGASFELSDNPDNMTSFPYYGYQLEDDATQVQQQIKIKGANFTGIRQDVFSGDGTTTQFTLTFVPDRLTSVTVGGVAQWTGTVGRDTFAGGSWNALVNIQSKYIVFRTAPSATSNNVIVTYSYLAPISTTTTLATLASSAPNYAIPAFTARISDNAIADLATATDRGLIEILKNGIPLRSIACNAQKFAPAGSYIYFTSVVDNIITKPYYIQSVTGSMLGKSTVFGTPVNEFQYKLGSYQPTLIDHLRNAHKALYRSSFVANVTAEQQTDIAALDIFGYHDSLTATPLASHASSTYGTAVYGSNAYANKTNTYGTATYDNGVGYA